MVQITSETPKRERNRLIKELMGRPVRITVKDHLSISNIEDKIKSEKFKQLWGADAKLTVFGVLVDMGEDYLRVASAILTFMEEVQVKEFHKVLLNDIIDLKDYVPKDQNHQTT